MSNSDPILRVTKQSRIVLVEKHDEAVKLGQDRFEFQGATVLTSYAEYLIEYLPAHLVPDEDKLFEAWQYKLVAASEGYRTQLGTILLAIFGISYDTGPAFNDVAVVTSDGFVMCDYRDRNGQYHTGAFVGGVEDVEQNTIGIARHCDLNRTEATSLFEAVSRWLNTGKRGPMRTELKKALATWA